MNKSESIAALSAALATAQGEVENASKNAKNPHFRNNYADLAEILNTVRPVFSRHGLSLVQMPSFSDGVCHVETLLTHASGEWISNTASAPVGKLDAQGVGSAITYLRRYSLAAFCGIAQEDDDGNAASQREAKPAAKPAPKPVGDVHDNTLDWEDLLPAVEGVEQLNSAQSRPLYKALEGSLKMAQTASEAAHWAHENAAEIWKLHPTARHYLREAYDKLTEQLMEAA